MLTDAGFDDVKQLEQRRNPRNDYTDWASFQATKAAGPRSDRVT